MGSLSRFRKAYGALKDSTAVSLAKLKSDVKDLDIAIGKATNHVEAPPKERHIQKIFAATAITRPRADVAYCKYALSRRLTRTRNWIVAIKVLIIIHRALREGDPTFREELMNYSYKGHILHMANFKDDSSTLASVCSEWVRSYALYIEERLECIRILKYDIEAEQLTRDCADATQVSSRTRVLSVEELLIQLPALQELLYRIVGCQPEGRACTNYLIQYSLSLVLIESCKIYGAINDGIINLVDTYFEMPKHDAIKALSICKRAGKQAEILAVFYDFCKHLELGRNFEFPTIIQIPSFLATMEVYVKEEPQTSSISCRQPTPDLQVRDGSQHVEENPKETKEQEDSNAIRKSEFPDLMSIDDLLGLNDMAPKSEESNALALFNTSTGIPKSEEVHIPGPVCPPNSADLKAICFLQETAAFSRNHCRLLRFSSAKLKRMSNTLDSFTAEYEAMTLLEEELELDRQFGRLPSEVLETMTNYSPDSNGSLRFSNQFECNSIGSPTPSPPHPHRLTSSHITNEVVDQMYDQYLQSELVAAEKMNDDLANTVSKITTAHVMVCLERDEMKRFMKCFVWTGSLIIIALLVVILYLLVVM